MYIKIKITALDLLVKNYKLENVKTKIFSVEAKKNIKKLCKMLFKINLQKEMICLRILLQMKALLMAKKQQ